MIDFVLGVALAALLIRGWLRGLVREAIGLAVIVVGAFLAFRLAGPMGAIVSAMSGAGDDAARFAGGIIVFILVSVGGGVLSWLTHKGVNAIPGLPTANRVGGAAFSGLTGMLVATVVVTVLALLPLPEAVSESLDGSSLVGAMTDGDGLPQKLLGFISFDRVLTSALELQKATGDHRLVAPQRGSIAIEPAAPSSLSVGSKAAEKFAELLNRSRVRGNADPLARSAALDDVALTHATALYQGGMMAHNVGSGRIGVRLNAAGIPVVASGELIALAPTVRSAEEAILEDDAGGADVVNRAYHRIGVAVIKGPLGLLVVAVLAG